MSGVHEVANYFLSLGDEEAGDLLSNLKLQKLCYYAQGFHLALFNEPLFNEPIEAWTHGPVVPELYHSFKSYGANPIDVPNDFDSEVLSSEVCGLLDEIYQVYGQYSPWKLRNMTHDEAPWVQAYNQAPGTTISHDALLEFFKTLVH
jgi:uncharacterized phage-associated protein